MAKLHRAAAVAAGIALLTLVAEPARAQAFDLPDIPSCTQFTPGAVGVPRTPARLAVRVVLDGISDAAGHQVVARALNSYIPEGITLEVGYDTADFKETDGTALIDEVRQSYGGRRPPDSHLVYVMTSKDLTDGGALGNSLAGLADCIGGVANPENAFAVGEGNSSVAAEIMAHEIGHLLGGHHHYANCVESLPNGGDNLCTLMINDVGLAGLPFSSANGVVVRGHAQIHGGETESESGEGAGTLSLATMGLLAVAAVRRRLKRAE